MSFIDRLSAEVRQHSRMETDFKSRRYHQARNLAGKYVDMIEEAAQIAARNGDYEQLEHRAVISGFCALTEKDFEMPIVCTERVKPKKGLHKKRTVISLNPENELFEVFCSAFNQLCAEEHIRLSPFQVRIRTKDGRTGFQTFPCTIRNPKKDIPEAFGFPWQIELDTGA